MENTITREFSGFTVRSVSVSEMANNVYLLTSQPTDGTGADGGAPVHVLVDAADDMAAIRRLIEGAGGGEVAAILTTHRHWDHVRALREAQTELSEHTFAGAEDAEAIEEESGATVATRVSDGQVLNLAGLEIECIALRGHTPGSIAYVLRDGEGSAVILSGDSLFPGGPGKTWSPEDFTQLMDDLEERIFARFPDDTLVLPGHGDSTALGLERPSLEDWRARGW
ncbi:MBL fold metallo-hydrolase [Brevibacterium album]|uniref:MBL fold metallo-hydrolase n=1 Tax=Brevibacterium album TaxID=417948 RepID=UPI00041EB138|nr:MBL fold metallo-hydrolase [Brevibacterium album]